MKGNVKVGIIGIGMVGTQVMNWFLEERGYRRGKDLFCYDRYREEYADNISEANICFICVPTPSLPHGSCDISIVESVIKFLPDRKDRRAFCIVVKSTVPPGTTKYLAEKYRDKGCFLFNPEFLTQKQAWEDFIRPDRQIVAAADEESRRWLGVVIELLPVGSYQSPGVKNTYDFFETDSNEAELAKYAGNVHGALRVVFFNILYDLCESLGADFETVRQLVTHDRRIGSAWSRPLHGAHRGYGGMCFPKDTNALIALFEGIYNDFYERAKKKGFAEADVKNLRVLRAGLRVLQDMRAYNCVLLDTQGLNES